ncbi:hydroxymethylpyrimidine/phosphomethylpyrimidine kinase [Dyadobacter jejuensis]|uniref:hydroxymethylpyrimidine kinase n=1 Tax=Dyadobacter jejuensis TaxID=1082580 RepID=A0A316ABN1_9BACT|nr:bifunctional hydroxymethylpyrimidine kinase/phosphomethylpyrimidine kinase [Dyadobacter jejuensis]PWJ54274.1 hydroxymethylpyrimidine/phosphomethylpyrimidine kinase [Dyadobacter jejuensis]
MKRYPTVLTIAGSDSGGGAGIQADLKTVAALGGYGMSAITALTAQNTMGVSDIMKVPGAFLKSQLEAVFQDFLIDSVKIGMVNTIESAEVIAAALEKYVPRFVVFDPVMVSTSGSKLIEDKTVAALWALLFPKVHLITPNLDEAEILVGRKINSEKEMEIAAQEMIDKGCQAVLLKGGHLVADKLYDVFAQKDSKPVVLETPYIDSKNLHGTGCTLSSAIATYSALDLSLMESVLMAKNYIADAIQAGKNVVTGHGLGPLNHSYSPQKMYLK